MNKERQDTLLPFFFYEIERRFTVLRWFLLLKRDRRDGTCKNNLFSERWLLAC